MAACCDVPVVLCGVELPLTDWSRMAVGNSKFTGDGTRPTYDHEARIAMRTSVEINNLY